jgi:hypothetical protein
MSRVIRPNAEWQEQDLQKGKTMNIPIRSHNSPPSSGKRKENKTIDLFPIDEICYFCFHQLGLLTFLFKYDFLNLSSMDRVVCYLGSLNALKHSDK